MAKLGDLILIHNQKATGIKPVLEANIAESVAQRNGFNINSGFVIRIINSSTCQER